MQKGQSEYSVMHACVSKRKGLSIKSRMLVLTNKARMLYFDMNGEYKGTIPWTVTKPVSTALVSSVSVECSEKCTHPSLPALHVMHRRAVFILPR